MKRRRGRCKFRPGVERVEARRLLFFPPLAMPFVALASPFIKLADRLDGDDVVTRRDRGRYQPRPNGGPMTPVPAPLVGSPDPYASAEAGIPVPTEVARREPRPVEARRLHPPGPRRGAAHGKGPGEAAVRPPGPFVAMPHSRAPLHPQGIGRGGRGVKS